MRIHIVIIYCLSFFANEIYGQLKSPDDFLPHDWGTHFTPHHQLIDYFEHVAANSPNVKLLYYGHTNEQRPLVMAFISTPQNLAKLENIRLNNLRRAGALEGSTDKTLDKAIIWISCSVHGNEAAGSESSMMSLYELVNPANNKARFWLDDAIIVIDPSINPDGYSRYTDWYRKVAGNIPDVSPNAIEHQEPWPGGRTNHYYFDLNRDWAWQTQIESRQRLKVINDWMPHIHADLHEQGINSPYYFAPAAQPYHKYITKWQRDFQVTIGKNHARYFDAEGWLYFTKEVFDLLYPSYGDTYPTYNGAIGMTYEQGGSGRAGRAVLMNNGDTLTLMDRVLHHKATTLSTIQVGVENRDEILQQFEAFFKNYRENPPGAYKTFIIKGTNPQQKIKALCNILDLNKIEYGKAVSPGTVKALDYRSGNTVNVSVEPNDLVISAYQTRAALTQILFEPNTELVDSLTYDITAWALPYAYGLESYATSQKINVEKGYDIPVVNNELLSPSYAFLIPWNSFESVQMLASLYKAGIFSRYALKPFSIGEETYPAGTLVITMADNRKNENFINDLKKIASGFNLPVNMVFTGFVDSGADFGSGSYPFIETPKIAILGGGSTRSNSFGQLWFYFEEELQYPARILEEENFANLPFKEFNVLILTDGAYDLNENAQNKLLDWIRSGGHLILIGSSNESFKNLKGFNLSTFADEATKQENEKKEEIQKMENRLNAYGDEERTSISYEIPGAIVKNHMDITHPLAFGLGGDYFSLKTTSYFYQNMKDTWNVGTIGDELMHSGFIGSKIKDQLKRTTTFAVQDMGRGCVTYMVDNPTFRAFWYNGKILLGNALFFVGN